MYVGHIDHAANHRFSNQKALHNIRVNMSKQILRVSLFAFGMGSYPCPPAPFWGDTSLVHVQSGVDQKLDDLRHERLGRPICCAAVPILGPPSMIPNLIVGQQVVSSASFETREALFHWASIEEPLAWGMKPLTVIWPALPPRKRVVWATSGSRWILVIHRFIEHVVLLKSFTQIRSDLQQKQTANRPMFGYLEGHFCHLWLLMMNHIVAYYYNKIV